MKGKAISLVFKGTPLLSCCMDDSYGFGLYVVYDSTERDSA